MTVVWPGPEARADRVGNKAFRLTRLLQAGLPVPSFFCVPASDLAEIGVGEIEAALPQISFRSVAVRSSALDEDDSTASSAGIYVTRLNVTNAERIKKALQEILESASSPAARTYRIRHQLSSTPGIAAIVQNLVIPISAGVLFTRDPLGGTDQIVVEGSWGLGEGIVSGLVQPDRWILSRTGDIISAKIANKAAAVVPEINGGTFQTSVESYQRSLPCLSGERLQELFRLAVESERLFGEPQDIEWAADPNRVWLLQSRPIANPLRLK
jgi:pyruvate,water dikinase